MPASSRRSRFALAVALGLLAAAVPARSEIIDRIAAVVEGRVITTSDVEGLIRAELVPRREGETDAEHRKRTLDVAIDFILRRRDAERFGLKDVTDEEVTARIARLAGPGSTPEALLERLSAAGIAEADLRRIVRQRLQIEAYVEERFAPLIFVSLDEIESYYQETWSRQRVAEGLPVPPLAEVREQLRQILRAERLAEEVRRWTEQLRNRANVDIYAFQ
jgi:parvulin-like peptidyl-prolyl isomerase